MEVRLTFTQFFLWLGLYFEFISIFFSKFPIYKFVWGFTSIRKSRVSTSLWKVVCCFLAWMPPSKSRFLGGSSSVFGFSVFFDFFGINLKIIARNKVFQGNMFLKTLQHYFTLFQFLRLIWFFLLWSYWVKWSHRTHTLTLKSWILNFHMYVF